MIAAAREADTGRIRTKRPNRGRTCRPAARSELDALVDGALVATGSLAVVDNVVFHWLLGWHRLNEAWSPGVNSMAEAALLVLRSVMVALGLTRRRRYHRRQGPSSIR